jgi:hypothetical protein
VSAVEEQEGRRDAERRTCDTTTRFSGLPGTGKRSGVRAACCVWGGADGKGLRKQHLAGGLLYNTGPTLLFVTACEEPLERDVRIDHGTKEKVRLTTDWSC